MRKLYITLVASFMILSAFAQDTPHYCQFRKQQAAGQRQGEDLQTLADNDRSDTIDVLNYNITLNITDFTAPDTIWGNTQVKFVPKMNGISTISLDLLKMNIDSIGLNSANLSWSYNDTLLVIDLPSVQNVGDTSTITVYYKGVPQGDASGWGGFYFQSGYAYNLGVGFAADPHNYGRVWFPCFDNFVERSTYEFNITTPAAKPAYCNGVLMSDTTFANGTRTRRWVMNNIIPSYLASVSVAGYTQVNQVFNGVNGPVPIVLTALPADTTNMKNSFVNLPGALTAFETNYGPYMWNRVGYCLVPFSSGAMEHATNISYPRLAANGSLTYETLYAHELSHHWWGDLATCETQEDMWLNEGMATYSEFIFTEHMYGHDAYKQAVRTNHEDILHNAHLKENGYRAISGIPHQYTYGDHVYLKGADVAHTLRGYLGDSLFFIGLQAHLAANHYTETNSTEFMNDLTAATGVNLTDFFNNWVFNGGWPHFSIDSFSVVPAVPAGYLVTVHIKQKLTGAPSYFSNVPLEITYMDAQWNNYVQKITMSGMTGTFTHLIPVDPVFAGINMDEKISHAVAPETKVLKTTGTSTLSNARMSITVQSVVDSAFIFVEHNYTSPDSFKTPKPYRISQQRYWKVSGIFPAGFDATAKLTYDGRTISSYGYNYWLDQILINMPEDSLLLLYRRDAADDWHIFPWYTKTIGNANDKTGSMTIDSLLPGEYAFGIHGQPSGIAATEPVEGLLQLYPNPSQSEITVELGNMNGTAVIRIMDMSGKVMHSTTAVNSAILDVSSLSNGIYIIEAQTATQQRRSRFVVLR